MDKKRPRFFAFVDLEKAFDRVPRAVLEWPLRELIVDDWLIKVSMSMYKNARSLVRVNGKLGEDFEVKMGVLSPQPNTFCNRPRSAISMFQCWASVGDALC